MTLTQEEWERINNLPSAREIPVALTIPKEEKVGNSYLLPFTITSGYYTEKSGVLLILKSPSGKEYTYYTSPIEYSELRKIVMRGGKLIGRTIILEYFTGFMGESPLTGPVYAPSVVVSIKTIESKRGGSLKLR